MSAIDHDKRRIEHLLRLIQSSAELPLDVHAVKSVRDRLNAIKYAAEQALSYIPNDPVLVPKRKTICVTFTGKSPTPVISEQFKRSLQRDYPDSDIEIYYAHRDMNRESRTYAQIISTLVGVIYGDDRQREGTPLQSLDDPTSKGYTGG